MKNNKFNARAIVLAFLSVIVVSFFVIAVSWTGNDISYFATEDIVYIHNLTANISSPESDMVFSVDTQNTVLLWNDVQVNYSSISSWIFVSNSTLGTFVINATRDNQTGIFRVPIKVTWGGQSAITSSFNFTVNATNDAPLFTSIQPEYNFSENALFNSFINASDEEKHYPLFFSVNFTSCEKASWSIRDNCTLFNAVNYSNTSALLSFTPSHDDVGKYYANVSVRDYGENYACSSGYCTSNYSQNKTTYYSQIVTFNVLSSLSVNISNCNNSVLYENSSFNCIINLTTKGASDSLIVSSSANLRNYATPSYVNRSWLYSNSSFAASNFSASILLNVTPQKREIGNWTINFTVIDASSGETKTVQIYVYVNRTLLSSPILDAIPDYTIYENKTIFVNAIDDDLLIPDKAVYNESLAFFSNMSGVSISSYSTPSGGNYTIARIDINYDYLLSSGAGNYSVRINVSDIEQGISERNFTISALSDSPPVWNSSMIDTFIIYEDNLTYMNLTQNVSDADNDVLNFSYSSDTSFPGFNLSSSGIINFTPDDYDVGQHILQINVTDGKLISSKTFNFSVYNVNDPPFVEQISAQTVNEDSGLAIQLYVRDDDLKIPSNQAGFYNESFSFNLTILGANSSLFAFNLVNRNISANRSYYLASFTPRKADVGNYNITVNVTDAGNLSYQINFTLAISSINHVPVLANISNQTSAINRSFYLRVNATDIEDGNSNSIGNANFTFSYSFLIGADFLNSTYFNSTTGEINMTFNSSQSGRYRINLTVNDTNYAQNSKEFWIFVYGYPNITFPNSSQIFSLQENNASNLTFRVNHSVQDNLTYYFYVGNSLKYSLSYYGNDTNLTWQFTPNFTEETYGKFTNFTLEAVNPNYSDLNFSLNWNANITHVNSPINFSGYVGDKQSTYTSIISVNLRDYFFDEDYNDAHYNQTVNFRIVSNSSPSYIVPYSSVSSDWVLSLSALISVSELITINATDLDSTNNSLSSAQSNSFSVQFTPPATTTVTTPSGGGGGAAKPLLLKLILPGPVSAYRGQKVILPIILRNSGKVSLNDINLTSSIAKNGVKREDINTYYDVFHINSLDVGQERNVSLIAEVNTDEEGLYEITLTGTVKNPAYSDWGKIYLSVKKGDTIENTILFTEELIAKNPECIEISELVKDAKKYYEQGITGLAIEKATEAIEACKYAISQQSLPKKAEKIEDRVFKYTILSTAAIFFIGTTYYFYKRRRLRKIRRGEIF